MVEYIKSLLFSLVILISPIKEAIFAISFLVSADLIMGIIASYKIEEKFSFKKIESTLIKVVAYNLLLLVSFVSEEYLMSYVPVIKICLSFLCIAELTSIGRNFQKITGLSFIAYLRQYIKNQIHKEKPPVN